MNLGAWLDTWLELYVDPTKLAKSTKECYHRSVRAVPGTLREIELQELSPLVLRRWLLNVAERYPRAAQLDRQTLCRALKVAGKLQLCPRDLLDEDTCPQIEHSPRKVEVLNAEELRAYMAAAATTDAAPILMLCCCGCRRGEAMGARWDALDLKAGTLAITTQRRDHDALPLKSKSSVRVIALPEQLQHLLQKWPRSFSGWVCDVSQQRVYKAHREALALAGLPAGITLHGLRHSMATIAALQGEPIKLIQAALGHAHYALTADLYADHLPPVAAITGRFLTA